MQSAREYMALKAPLVLPGTFAVEIRGAVPVHMLGEVEGLLVDLDLRWQLLLLGS